MGWLDFVAALVQACAWPIAFIVGAIVFKGEVKGLLSRITSGKALGFELTFGQGIERLETAQEAIVLAEKADKTGAAPVSNDPRLEALARDTAAKNPSFAVLSAWEIVLGRVHDFLASQLPPDQMVELSRYSSPSELAGLKRLRNGGQIGPNVVEVFAALRNLRDKVAHGESNPTVGEAVAFINNADFFVLLLHAPPMRDAP